MNHDNKPLTLEELRKMDGQPIYYKRANQWFIVELHHPYFGQCIISETGYFMHLRVAAERGVYAFKPIDLDDWTAEWKEIVTHNGCTADYDCVCSKCGASGVPNDDFCSSCGRAISDKARELLERRLRNSDNE